MCEEGYRWYVGCSVLLRLCSTRVASVAEEPEDEVQADEGCDESTEPPIEVCERVPAKVLMGEID